MPGSLTERSRRNAWAVPAVLAVVLTWFLCWGAWEAAHRPARFYASTAWTHTLLRPSHSLVALVASALWLVALGLFWWPRRLQPQIVGLTVIVAMVLIGGALAAAALGPCRGGQSGTAVVAWVLSLYTGQLETVYGSSAHMGCPGVIPPALQLGRAVCLGATLIGATAAAAVLWRQPVGRLRARLASDAIVLTGLDAITFPLLRRLTQTADPAARVVVIEPDAVHPMLSEARATGAKIMIADPASGRTLKPVIAGWRGCALRQLYALSDDATVNEAVLAAARPLLRRYPAQPARQPHLVARIDDPRHADHWRGLHGGSASRWFEDALSPAEATAQAVVRQLSRARAEQLVLCGDSTLALAILLELAHLAWEQESLAQAEATGEGVRGGRGGTANGHPAPRWVPAAGSARSGDEHLVGRVILLDSRAEDLRREYQATSPWCVTAPPDMVVQARPWREHLLATLGQMRRSQVVRTAVVIADPRTDATMHEAGRAARLYPETLMLVLSADGAGISDAIFDSLQPFQRGVLVDGDPPEDTWTRMARHWHECHRRANPVTEDDPRADSRRPWAKTAALVRQDNILQLRSILTEVAARGRIWRPVRAVPPGSFVELTADDIEHIARAEHDRWYRQRRADGWRSSGSGPLINASLVPWAELADHDRAGQCTYIRGQLARLEEAGFLPVIPPGGPAGAEGYRRTGVVRARQLSQRRRWILHSGEELSGAAGDWRVVDQDGDDRTVIDTEFRASHQPLGGDRWTRTGVFRAWRAHEPTALRTLEGRAVAAAGDWIVESPAGARWPVTDEAFRRGYRPASQLADRSAN